MRLRHPQPEALSRTLRFRMWVNRSDSTSVARRSNEGDRGVKCLVRQRLKWAPSLSPWAAIVCSDA
jgi:hypothetical protein